MAANNTKNQVEINGAITVENGLAIIGASLDYTQYNVTINPGQNTQADRPIKQFYGVPAENIGFVDRPNILADMKTMLGKSSPSSGCRILALKGLGGMGKTQLMLRYCYLYRAEYNHVFWLEVDSWSAAIDSFRNLAIHLGLDEESTKGKESKVINWVCSWFQNNKKWLLLLNNADDTMSKDVFKLLPRIGGDIILTTREFIPSSVTIVLPISRMQEEEALILLYGDSSMVNQDSQKNYFAREIIKELDFLPLAIDLARAYLKNTSTSFEEYLNMVKNKNRRSDLLEYSNEDNYPYKHTIATVWKPSLDRVRSENPIAAKILQACTFLQPENSPVYFFEQWYILEENSKRSWKIIQKAIARFTPPFKPKEKTIENNQDLVKIVRDAVAVLVKFSFVTICQDGGENPAHYMLTIHRLVQKVIYNTISGQELLWSYNIATALNKATYYDDSAIYSLPTRRIVDTYLPHIRHFITLLNDVSKVPFKSKDLCTLLDRVIWYLLQHGRYSVISELMQFSRLVSEATYGEEDYNIVTSLFNNAEFHRQLGKFDEAEPLYQRELAITEKAKGTDHVETAKSQDNLAALYYNWGKYDKAEPLYKRALAIKEKALGPEHPSTATSLDNLASMYSDQGKYNEAEPLYKRALAIREKELRSEHPDIAQSLNNLADHYVNQSKYDEAEPLHKRALAIYEKELGSEHPNTATSLINLAELYFKRRQYDKAEPLYKRALTIKEKALGSEHPYTISTRNNLARLYEPGTKVAT